MRSATVRAFAKINLSLEVLNKRPDGFHNLRTVFQTISLHDTIEIEVGPAPESHLWVDSDVDIPGENLILRAARAVLELTGTTAEIRFGLHKRIPMGGGLGGGSTDAAAVLLALPALLDKHVDPVALIRAASQLGSDVPFFLFGGTAVGLGRGTELYPMPDAVGPPFGLLLTPKIHVSTPDAYRLLNRTTELPAGSDGISSSERIGAAVAAGADWSDASVNDFESSVFAQQPALGDLRARLESFGAKPARMTGSGAAIFGMFGNQAARIRAEQELKYVVEPHEFEFISRAQYQAQWHESLRPIGQ